MPLVLAAPTPCDLDKVNRERREMTEQTMDIEELKLSLLNASENMVSHVHEYLAREAVAAIEALQRGIEAKRQEADKKYYLITYLSIPLYEGKKEYNIVASEVSPASFINTNGWQGCSDYFIISAVEMSHEEFDEWTGEKCES